jgi:hypothetical protein
MVEEVFKYLVDPPSSFRKKDVIGRCDGRAQFLPHFSSSGNMHISAAEMHDRPQFEHVGLYDGKGYVPLHRDRQGTW